MKQSVSVLHVDDDRRFRERSAQTIEAHRDQFSVETAATAEAALDRLAEESYDCVLSAQDLPETTGVEFLETVRARRPELPFILVAGADVEADANEAVSAGATEFFQKETDTLDLLATRVETAVSKQRTERRLDRQTDFFEMAQDIVDLGAWEVDLRTGDNWWTNVIAQLHDLPEDGDAGPRDGIELVHPDDKPTLELVLYQAVYEQEPYDLEFRIETGDRTRWVRSVCEPQVENGETVSLRGITQDITDKRQRQTVLKALHRVATAIQTEQTVEGVCERIARTAVEILEFDTCVVLIRDGEWLVPYEPESDTLPDGARPLQLNEGIAGKTYRTRDSYIVDDVTESAEATPASDHFRGAISVPVGKHGVFQAVSAEPGAYTPTDLEYAELLISHAANALDRIEHEQELKRQNERLEEFANIVSHDLRNPLNVAQLRLHLVREQVDNDDLESIAQAHDRMEQLIGDLLALAQAGNPVDDAEPVSLTVVTKEAWRNVETQDATLVRELDGTIQANESRLQQLLENLIRNSVEHGTTEEQSAADDAQRVTVTVGEIDDEGFYVADDGPGIPEDDHEKVFESGYTTREDGTGFGLPIVEDVVEAHDWEVEIIESESGGARFEITSVTFTTPDERSKNV